MRRTEGGKPPFRLRRRPRYSKSSSLTSRPMNNPAFLADGSLEVSYEPSYSLNALDWFHLAECARKRMTEKAGDIHQWRGERRSFYTAIQMMDADTKYLND